MNAVGRFSGIPFVGIPLLDRSGNPRAFALVDLADLPSLSGRRWHLTTQGYPRANRSGGGFDYLHRFLFGLRDGDAREVDHLNLDKLDNRRANLMVVEHTANAQNLPSIGRSKYRGVAWNGRGQWRATVRVSGTRTDLGVYQSEEEAGAVAAEARRRLMPHSAEARGVR